MNYADIREAREAAMSELAKADLAVRQAAELVVGHLRSAKVDRYTLRLLKAELVHFDATHKVWKEKS